jgi:3-demethoxyubiquinol 3-hydroxylase
MLACTARPAGCRAAQAGVTLVRHRAGPPVYRCCSGPPVYRCCSGPPPPSGGKIASDDGEVEDASLPGSSAAPRQRSPLLADAARKQVIDRMLRVDHAGEVGARQIYAGQLAVFGGTSIGKVIAHMAAQEQKHLDAFDRLVVERRVRPTAMMPVWNAAGYALGLGTALLGKEAAMACTVAVEEVIAEHYNDQVRMLLQKGWEEEEELRATFREFRDDELEHKDTGIEHNAERAPMYKALSAIIKAGCHTAIRITERV